MQKNKIVYSTDGRTKTGRLAGGDNVVRVSRERSGRRGKTVTLITGISGTDEERRLLAGNLKRACGSGGTVNGDTIEIQGDHREFVFEKLGELGHRVKLAGG